jgi:integrase/recombinase XerD
LVPFGAQAAQWLQKYLTEARPLILNQLMSDYFVYWALYRRTSTARQAFWYIIKRYAIVAGIEGH